MEIFVLFLVILSVLAIVNIFIIVNAAVNHRKIPSWNLIALVFLLISSSIQIYGIYNYSKNHPTKVPVVREDEKVRKTEVRCISFKCKNCGHRIDDEDKFCIGCGKPMNLSDYKKDNPTSYIIYDCPYCKEIVSTNTNFCNKCGHSLEKIHTQIEDFVINR